MSGPSAGTRFIPETDLISYNLKITELEAENERLYKRRDELLTERCHLKVENAMMIEQLVGNTINIPKIHR